MYTFIVARIIITGLLLLYPTLPIQIGQIQNAMLVINNTDSTTSMGRSIEDCLCQALANQSEILAFNYFSNNSICEFFTSYDTTFQVRTQQLSTLVLIKPLPVNPCCSNLTWLLNQIANTTEQYTINITAPRNLLIDNYDRLVTNEYLGRLIQMNRYNLSIINQISLSTNALGAISYNDGLYYAGVGVSAYSSAYALLVYNATDLSLVFNLTGNLSYFGPIRECRFLHNNTQMLVISQLTSSYPRILLYQINSPTNYTLLNSNIQAPYYAAYSIFKVNDTFFYFTLYVDYKPIYILTLSSDSQNWSITAFVTGGSQPQRISSVAVDSCGRVWAADQFSYIYIYDAVTGALLATFDKVPKPYYILLLNNYELFVGTQEQKVFRFAPNISCTC